MHASASGENSDCEVKNQCGDTNMIYLRCEWTSTNTDLCITINTNSLGQCPLFHGEDDAILTPNANGRATSSDSFHCIFHLKKVPIGAEYCDGTIVAHLC
jgi:hypothetical protein